MLDGLYVKLIIAGLILAAVIGAGVYVQNLRSTNEQLTKDKIMLTSKVKEQNDAVTALKADSDARLAAAAVELSAANTVALAKQGKATVIYKMVPSVPGADCASDRKSTLDLINSQVK